MFLRRCEREIITLGGLASTEWAREILWNAALILKKVWFHVEMTVNYL